MKKRHSIHVLLAAAALLLAMAACTKDELADGDRLPEGQYPLEIARITLGVEGGEAQLWGTPQTRVSEIADGTGSVFDAGDLFAVQIDGKDEVGIYTVQDDHTAKAETPLYWSDTGEHTVTAWYPAKSGTIDLGNQSQSLAYLLYATGTGDYQTPVTLTFAHQLAKVRVTPSDDALDQVQSLQLYTYTQCTYEKGEVVQGSQEGWIEMKPCEYTENGATINCWEANVVPDYTITKLRANGTEERTLSSAITPVAGKFYNITLDYDPGYTTTTDDQGQTIYNTDNEKGLKNLAKLVNEEGKTDIDITLTGNITLTGEWTPIGTESQPYTGTFDGGGKYTITGLKIDQSGTDYVGLIGRLGSGGTVQDVTLTEVNVTGGTFVGGNEVYRMKQKTIATRHLRTKIAAGYVLILFVIFGIVYIGLNEQNRQQELEATTYKIRSLRKDVHEVYMKVVDLSMIGETDGSDIKYFHFFCGYMGEISYLCYVNNNTESNGDKL